MDIKVAAFTVSEKYINTVESPLFELIWTRFFRANGLIMIEIKGSMLQFLKILPYHPSCFVSVRTRCRYAIFACNHWVVLLDFSLTVKAAPNECVIRTSQP